MDFINNLQFKSNRQMKDFEKIAKNVYFAKCYNKFNDIIIELDNLNEKELAEVQKFCNKNIILNVKAKKWLFYKIVIV